MKNLDLDQFITRDSSNLAKTTLVCPHCGRNHAVPFGKILIGKNILASVAEVAKEILEKKPSHPVLIFDRAIEPVIQTQIIDPLTESGLSLEPFGLGAPGVMLNSEQNMADQAASLLPMDADILISAGSGVISDTTKWIATKTHKPFITIGTAASMNGYTSITATITENDVKISEHLSPANAVILDTEILAKAPVAMTRSGYGDLLARTVCNADWKLSSLICSAYFCPVPYQMTAENERSFLSASREIGQSDPAAIAFLGEAILKSGLSMTVLNGETSPSSGAEHVLSHYWDFLVHLRGSTKNFHGVQVGLASLIMLHFYEFMRQVDPRKIDPAALLRKRPSIEQIEMENRALYGEKAASFNAVVCKKRIPDQEFIPYIQNILNYWDDLWNNIEPYLAPAGKIAAHMREAGITLTLDSIHRSKQDAVEALLKGSHYRSRYTLLDFAWEIGLFPDAAEVVLENAGLI